MQDQDISALVSSRICHDLISPIGAISNGVELLAGFGGHASPELGLIGDSVNSASEKLRCFRIAFGAAPAGARIALGEVRAALEALGSGRSSVTVQASGADLPRVTAKAALLALLCQERCLPLGGSTRLALAEDRFGMETAAPRIRDVEPLWALLTDAGAKTDVAPAEVQFVLLGHLVRQHGAQIERDSGAEGMSLRVTGLTP